MEYTLILHLYNMEIDVLKTIIESGTLGVLALVLYLGAKERKEIREEILREREDNRKYMQEKNGQLERIVRDNKECLDKFSDRMDSSFKGFGQRLDDLGVGF